MHVFFKNLYFLKINIGLGSEQEEKVNRAKTIFVRRILQKQGLAINDRQTDRWPILKLIAV